MNDQNRRMLLWLDTETTAIKPEDGQLLEIGMRITNLDGTIPSEWQGYNPYNFSTVIPHSRISYTRDTEHAIRMHQDNGLLDEVLGTQTAKSPGEWLLDIVDKLQDGGLHITLHPAGTNVDFDLAWLKAHQPKLIFTPLWDDTVSYRKLDLSTVRLTLATVDINPYRNSKNPKHRVNDCLNRDILDWMNWVEWVKEHMAADDPNCDCDFGNSLQKRFERDEYSDRLVQR